MTDTPNNVLLVAEQVREKRRSLIRWYGKTLIGLPGIRGFCAMLHRRLNLIQYDPVNPHNRTHDNPDGYISETDAAMAAAILADKTLIDKIESYFKLRPFSNGIMYFFVIAGAAAGMQRNVEKILTALVIILLLLPLLTSKQGDFE